jgi:hypothetical protein
MLTVIENVSWIIILPIFALLFAVIWRAVKRISLFSERTGLVVAVAVTILCLISMFDFDLSTQSKSQGIGSDRQVVTKPANPEHQKREFILLPYLALGISILASFIFMLLYKAWATLKKSYLAVRKKAKGIHHRSDRYARANPKNMNIDALKNQDLHTLGQDSNKADRRMSSNSVNIDVQPLPKLFD